MADTPALSPSDDKALPAPADDYAVLVGPQGADPEQVAEAEEFGETLVATQNLIQRYSQQYDTLKHQMSELRESLNNLFENDEELQAKEAEAKTLTTDLKAKRQQVKEAPEAVQLQLKIKELGEERKEIEEALNNHLLRYYQLTGSQVIENPDGSEREFSVNARLKGKKKTDE
jgi:chromosome segregation ATPase